MVLSLTRFRIRDHITNILGPISKEWEEGNDGRVLPFSIVKIDGCPMPGTFTLVTVGLSERELAFPSGASARQELLFSCYDRYETLNVQGLIGLVALECAHRNQALARGEVVGPSGPVLTGVRMEALFASLPAYTPDAFATCDATSPRTHFMWLVPITRVEAQSVTQKGWQSLEDLFVKEDPDLLNLDRPEIPIPVLSLKK